MNHPHSQEMVDYIAKLNRETTNCSRSKSKLLALFVASVAINFALTAALIFVVIQ